MRFILPAVAGILAAFAMLAPPAAASGLPPVDYPAIPVTVTDQAQLVPPGWKLEAEAKGDLNGDKRADLALIIQSETPDRSTTGNPLVGPRMLIVALASKDKPAGTGYSIVLVNHTLIPRSDDGDLDDCFVEEMQGLTIAGGRLAVRLNFFASAGAWAMWNKIYEFNWRSGHMMLARMKWDNSNRSSGATTLTIADYRKKRLTVSRGNIENDETKTVRSSLPGRTDLSIEQVGNGMEFEPVPQE